MGKKNKLQRFADLMEFENVYENFNPKKSTLTTEAGLIEDMKGKWGCVHFNNSNPIILELACGKGDYTLGLARKYPNKNFIGVDIKGARIWKGAKTALEENLSNVAFLRARIELIEYFFAKDEIDEIWITFPDPFLKRGKNNRRLCSPSFINRYRNILKKNGIVHLKTDSPELFDFSFNIIKSDPEINLIYSNPSIYSSHLIIEDLDIKTFYEIKHIAEGKTIKYVQFSI